MQNSSSSVIQETQPAGATLLLAIAGALVGAVLGGVIWAIVGVITEKEIGYVALGVGFFAGGGVVVLSRQRGPIFQLIALAASVVGIFLGKYYLYYHFFRKNFIDAFSEEIWETMGLSLFSSDMLDSFIDDLPDILGGMDLLFFGLAMLVAWGIPSVKAGEVAAQQKMEKSEID